MDMGILNKCRVCNGELRDYTRKGYIMYNVQCSFQAQLSMQMSQLSSEVETFCS